VFLGTVIAVVLLGVQPALATWSVVAVDNETGEVGVAVASCVGSEVTVVPVLVPGVGAAASQAHISPPSGARIVKALLGGATAEEAINVVVSIDDAPDERQFGVVVLDDGGSGWTGADTLDVAVDRRSSDGTASVQGNILVTDGVVDAAIAAFDASAGDLPDRLLAALVAGADEGGDARCGEQTATSAALIVARRGDQVYAFTDVGVLGVDPDTTTVPSVFVSVLVPEGGDRAPDRLAEAWANADHDASIVTIRQIDPGANTATQRARTVVIVFLAVVGLIVAGVVVVVIRWRRRAATPA
jgi:uncharacterized Ntn-hydrolase superfamily protein